MAKSTLKLHLSIIFMLILLLSAPTIDCCETDWLYYYTCISMGLPASSCIRCYSYTTTPSTPTTPSYDDSPPSYDDSPPSYGHSPPSYDNSPPSYDNSPPSNQSTKSKKSVLPLVLGIVIPVVVILWVAGAITVVLYSKRKARKVVSKDAAAMPMPGPSDVNFNDKNVFAGATSTP